MLTQGEHAALRRRGVVAAALIVLCAGLVSWVGCGSHAAVNTSPARGTYRVPSGAMLPTLRIGQRVNVVQAYRQAAPRLDDIVVFHPPHGADLGNGECGNNREGGSSQQPCGVPTPHPSKQIYIKRIAGLPGDRIALVDGHVIRNGTRRQEAHILACPTASLCTYPKSVVIPPGDYFLLGDNRGESEDSRFWGPVPRSWVIGKVVTR